MVIEAVTVPQELFDPPVSQLKSMLLELPVTSNVPVNEAPLIWYVNTLDPPTWSMFSVVVDPTEDEAVVELPTVLFDPSCVMSRSSVSPDCVT
jgi:hypothetical protein